MHHHEILEACASVLGRVVREGLPAVLGRPVHAAADVLPLLDPDALAELAASIADRGYLSAFPVVYLHGGGGGLVLLDGRNRLLACVALGLDLDDLPDERVLLDDEEAVQFVRAATTRRELDVQTRTVVLAELHRLESEAARAAGRAKGGTTRTGEGAGILRGVERTALAVAAETGESPRTVRRRLQAERDGGEDVRAALRAGTIEPGPAAEVASLPPEVQARALANPVLRRAVLAAETERKRTEREACRVREVAAARASAPEVPAGVDLRLATNATLLADPALRGAAHLVHADPAWPAYDTGAGTQSSAESAYDLAPSYEDIVADLDAAYDVAAEDARLLVWVTWPHLLDFLLALGEVGCRWEYLTGGAWTKSGQPGIGYHWRGTTEPVLVFRKGAPGRSTAALPNGWTAPRGAHSEKPADWLTEIVRAWVPTGGVVVDLYAGLAPVARACVAAGVRYVGAESDPDRHVLALAALEGEAPPEPEVPAAEAPKALRDVAEARGWTGPLQALADVLRSDGWTRSETRPYVWAPPVAST
jgi:hypothetical protein